MVPQGRQLFAKRVVKSVGWGFEGELPSVPKFVCVAAPHTSNWDGLILVFVANSLGVELSWMVKDTIVKGPFAPFMRHFGAVPIDRSGHHNVVDQMIGQFRSSETFALAVPPEGTRAKRDYWKSGFYHIACGAGVPVILGYLDYERKKAGLSAPIEMTGDVNVDMDRIREFYDAKNVSAYRPELVGPIRLRDED